MCLRDGKDPVQKYEDGEITLQKMFNEQDEEIAEDIFFVFVVTTIVLFCALVTYFLM